VVKPCTPHTQLQLVIDSAHLNFSSRIVSRGLFDFRYLAGLAMAGHSQAQMVQVLLFDLHVPAEPNAIENMFDCQFRKSMVTLDFGTW
jgi:hypothetical protein